MLRSAAFEYHHAFSASQTLPFQFPVVPATQPLPQWWFLEVTLSHFLPLLPIFICPRMSGAPPIHQCIFKSLSLRCCGKGGTGPNARSGNRGSSCRNRNLICSPIARTTGVLTIIRPYPLRKWEGNERGKREEQENAGARYSLGLGNALHVQYRQMATSPRGAPVRSKS